MDLPVVWEQAVRERAFQADAEGASVRRAVWLDEYDGVEPGEVSVNDVLFGWHNDGGGGGVFVDTLSGIAYTVFDEDQCIQEALDWLK